MAFNTLKCGDLKIDMVFSIAEKPIQAQIEDDLTGRVLSNAKLHVMNEGCFKADRPADGELYHYSNSRQMDFNLSDVELNAFSRSEEGKRKLSKMIAYALFMAQFRSGEFPAGISERCKDYVKRGLVTCYEAIFKDYSTLFSKKFTSTPGETPSPAECFSMALEIFEVRVAALAGSAVLVGWSDACKDQSARPAPSLSTQS